MPPPLRQAARHGLTYRPMNDADLPFVAALYASTRAEEVSAVGWPEALQQAFLRQQHEAQHKHYSIHYPDAERLIVEQEGVAIGRLYLADLGAELRIVDISLVPEARGRGIGGAMLADILADSEAAGTAVSIHVEKNNPARRLYDRLGFAKVEDKGVYDLMRRDPQ